MTAKKAGIATIYNTAISALLRHKGLYLPFVIFFVFELLALIILYSSPRQPLITIFGPPIKTFWGERFLHYPFFFMLLPKLLSHARMVLSVFIGSLTAGLAVIIAGNIYNMQAVKFSASLKSAIRKYVYFFLVILAISLLFYFSQRGVTVLLAKYFLSGRSQLLFLGARTWLGPGLVIITFLLALIIQAALIYSIPILCYDNKNILKSLAGSVVFFGKNFFASILLVGLPMLLYVPIILLNANVRFLINDVFPESVAVVSSFGIVISSLIIDPIVTVTTAYLYLTRKEPE